MDRIETPRWMQGKHFSEELFCEDFLAVHPMVCVSGSFFTVDGRITDEENICGRIYEILGELDALHRMVDAIPDEVIRAYTTQKYVHHGRMKQEI